MARLRKCRSSVPQGTNLTGKTNAAFLGLAASFFAAFAASAEEVERLVVVGSRAEPRTVTDTAAPVDIITGAQIARTGITETSRLIQALIPSFNFSVSTISDGTDAVRPATLRGLYPDQVLVLVNGKRRHNSALTHINGSVGRGSAGTDLNAIPPSAIERIEVLRDGASAQYGSDAIAGIINIVLKRQTEATEVYNYFGETYQGDGDQRRHSVNTGWALAGGGFLNLSLERRGRNRTNRAGDDPRCQYSDPCTLTSGREAAFDRLNHRFGDAESDNSYLAFTSAMPLAAATLYASGTWSRRDTQAGGFYRRALDRRNRPNIYPDGFLPMINTDVEDASLTVGARTQLGEWDVDASVTHGRNTFEFRVTNSLNVSLGDNSPRSADSGELVFGQTTFNLDAVRPLNIGLAEPLNLAAGYEYRRDEYEIKAGEPDSYRDGGVDGQDGTPGTPGIQVFPGFRPENEADESRHNHAFYIDAETRLSERLRAGAAVRYEDYSDFGSDLNGKLSARYEFSDRFALRGTLSSGFRAPGLAQHYFDNVSTQFNVENGVTVARETLTARNEAAFARAIGVEELKEETSFNLSLGFVARPFDNLSLSVDAYLIEVDDRIVLSSRLGGDQIRPELQAAALAILNRDYGFNLADISGLRFQFFTNAIDTRTRGVDVVAEWSHWFDHGASLKLTGAANVNSSDVEGGIDLPAGLTAGTDLFSANEVGYIESGHPRQSYKFQAHYLLGVHDLTLRLNRYGSVTSNYDAVRQTYGARWLADIEYTHHFGADVDWTVGVNNLLDTRPERNLPENSFNGSFPYNRRASPFDYNGGFYFTSLKVSF